MIDARRGRRRPLVAIVSDGALVSEGIAAAMDGLAELLRIRSATRDLPGLLRSIDPDATVVDTAADAEAIAPVALEFGMPVVHVALREQKVRVLEGDTWRELFTKQATAEDIRNAVAGAIYGRVRR